MVALSTLLVTLSTLSTAFAASSGPTTKQVNVVTGAILYRLFLTSPVYEATTISECSCFWTVE